MADKVLIVHTTAPVNKQTGQQLCARCGDQLHFVNVRSLPKEGSLANPEAHCFAGGINVVIQSPPIVLGDFKEGEAPPIGEFCQKIEKKK